MATIYRIGNLSNICSVGATSFANKTGLDKGKVFYFKITDLKTPAALILKQECVSVGGDFILPKESILANKDFYDGILIATSSQLSRIIAKCSIQPFGLVDIAKELESHMNHSCCDNINIMGVINITDDSFYGKSRIKCVDDVINRVIEWIDYGVDIIDIGGASTRPDSEFVSSDIELSRISAVIDELYNVGLTKQATFSIDSYNPDTIKYCLDRDFKIINDVYSLKDEKIISLAKDYDSRLVLMHNSWIYPHEYSDIIVELDTFFRRKLDVVSHYGVDDIILDIGFGFGKSSTENIALISNLSHFLRFGFDILVGASRKRTIGDLTSRDVNNRLAGTLSMHQIAIANGANMIRVHDVKEHIDMINILKAFS